MNRIMKEAIVRDRIRVIRGGFGWVDHRLVRDGYIQLCSPRALALYLFLLTVSDGDGLSYWGEAAICKKLRFGRAELGECRTELVAADLIAYEKPLWQVLQLPAFGRCSDDA